ncbi:hypothetical protein SteCoe_15576 [Stentor coeruleus]|uniref:Uncharacterized protein n=1 Tax=Stentor coeruleus TaxID=5963 RepID=A0A1R2C3G2_9CILI|nr:hypothetical protein SteCoe_15576 [Stentor coeruleus]
MEKYFGSRLIPEIWSTIACSSSVLLISCEGGFNLLHTLPLYFSIKNLGKEVHLCNMSLVSLKSSTAEVIYYDQGISQSPILYKVDINSEFSSSGTKNNEYFPEKYLSEWFQNTLNLNMPIYCTERIGIKNLSEAYKLICQTHNIDLIIIIDQGSDSLMSGDEQEIGSFLEDMLTIFSVYRTEVKAILCNIAIGYDRFNGVSDCSSWRAIAELIESGGFLGNFSLLNTQMEVQLYKNASLYVEERMKRKNFSGCCIRAALEGKFGKLVHDEDQRVDFIMPIMSQMFFFKLDEVVKRIKYREMVEETKTAADFVAGIEYFRNELTVKVREEIPRTKQF